MASTEGAARAARLGYNQEFICLQKARQNYGLLDDERTQVLPTRFAIAMGFQRPADGPEIVECSISNADLAAAIRRFLNGYSLEQRAIACLTWNLTPDPAIDVELVRRAIVPMREKWVVRTEKIAELVANDRAAETQFPIASVDSGTIRGKSDALIVDLIGKIYARYVTSPSDDVSVARSSTTTRAIRSPLDSADDPKPESAVDELLSTALSDSERFIALSDASVNSESLEVLLSMSKFLGRSYNHQAPDAVLNEALALRHKATLLIDRTRDPNLLRDLFFIHGRILGIIAYATLDLGRPDAAYVHALAAVKSSKLASHNDLQAWALGTQSLILRFRDEVAKSMQVVENGLSLSVRRSTIARLHAQSALGNSELGRQNETLDSLRACEATVDADDVPMDMTDGIYLFPRAKYHYYAGNGLLRLGDEHASRAAAESREAISRFRYGTKDEQSYSDELLARVFVAGAEFKCENLDAVPDVLTPLFEASPEFRTSWHVQWLKRLVRNIEQNARYNRSTVAIELRRDVEKFVSDITD